MLLHKNREWLHKMYTENGLGCEAIGRLCEVSQATIHKYLVSFGIPRRAFQGMSGIRCGRWKSGRTMSKAGYVWVHIDKPHIRQISKRHHYVPEQILVVEKALDRLLTKQEATHHINEVKSDNRIENLYIFENEAEHQRYHGKLRRGTCLPITESNCLMNG